MTSKEYIDLYGPYVVVALKGKALFPSVMIAQALLESASKTGVPGGSLLASKYNNHFGIKADASWKGESVSLNTHEFVKGERFTIKQVFRVYENPQQSFDDRIEFLLRNPRYRKGGVFTSTSASEQATRLQRSGYATDPDYATKLIGLINKHNLSALDRKSI